MQLTLILCAETGHSLLISNPQVKTLNKSSLNDKQNSWILPPNSQYFQHSYKIWMISSQIFAGQELGMWSSEKYLCV